MTNSMKFLSKLKIDGFGSVEVYVSSRNGSSSPKSFYYKLNGRWITPYERKVRNWPYLNSQQIFLIQCGEILASFRRPLPEVYWRQK